MHRDGSFDGDLTYGEGAVAAFPRGAIQHPSLLLSACVLFDSVTVLKPVDLKAEAVRRGINWQYQIRRNKEADDFWHAVQPLVDTETIKPFRISLSPSEIRELRDHPGKTRFGKDTFDIDKDETGQTWYMAVGFTEYFEYLGANGLPLLLSQYELHDTSAKDTLNISLQLSKLSPNSARILNGCLPEIETAGYPPDKLVFCTNAIRGALQTERAAYMSLIGRLSVLLTEASDAEECGATIDSMSSDTLEIWEAYQSKLFELANNHSLPLRFGPLLNSVVTLDQIGCGEELLGHGARPLSRNRQEQMMAFVWRVNRVEDFWQLR